MADSSRVNLLDPNGDPVNVDASEAQQAIQQGGYTVPNDAQIQDVQDDAEYGDGVGNSAKAFGAAAARAATFGLSDHLLTDTGLADPRTLTQLEKRHKIADTAGTVTGIVAPMLVGDELGAANLVKGVGKLGSAAEAATAAALPAGESLAGRILAKAGSKAVGSAIEGAAYGLGNVVSESALGDPSEVAEHAVSQIGLSALLGGGIGGLVGLGGVVIPEAVQKAKNSLSSIFDRASGAAGDAFSKVSSAVSGVPEASIAEALQNRHLALPTAEARAATVNETAESLADQYKETEAALKTANRDIRPGETADLVKGVDETGVNEEYKRVFNKLGDTIQEMREKPDIYPGRFASKLEDIQKGLMRDGQAAQTPAEVFATLNDLKQTLDSKVLKFDGVTSAADSDAINLVKSLRGDLKGSLENEGVFGPGASRQAAFNEAQNEYFTAKKEFQKNFLYKTKSNNGGVTLKANPTKVNAFYNGIGTPQNEIRKAALDRYMKASKNMIDEIQESYTNMPTGKFDQAAHEALAAKNASYIENAEQNAQLARLQGQVNTGQGDSISPFLAGGVAHAVGLPGTLVAAGAGAYKALANPGGTIQRLVALESLANKSSAKISSGVQAILSGSSRAFSVGRGEVAAGLAKDFGKDHEDSVPVFEKRTAHIQELYADAAKFHGVLSNSTADLSQHAPKVAQGMQMTAVTGINFLNSKIPQHPKQGPLDSMWSPSKSEVSKFNRYYNAVQNPTSNCLGRRGE